MRTGEARHPPGRAARLRQTRSGGPGRKNSPQPKNTALEALKQTSFLGTTLRGLLLEAYAFAKIGQVMLWGAIASFLLAAVLSRSRTR
jgi:hypothetical protein